MLRGKNSMFLFPLLSTQYVSNPDVVLSVWGFPPPPAPSLFRSTPERGGLPKLASLTAKRGRIKRRLGPRWVQWWVTSSFVRGYSNTQQGGKEREGGEVISQEVCTKTRVEGEMRSGVATKCSTECKFSLFSTEEAFAFYHLPRG